MALTIDNLIETSEAPKVGQRVVQVSRGVWLPVGMGGSTQSSDAQSSVVKLTVISSMSQSDIRSLFDSIPSDMGGKTYAVLFEPSTYTLSNSLSITKSNGRLLLYSQESDSRASLVINNGIIRFAASNPCSALQMRNLNVTSLQIQAGPIFISKNCTFTCNRNNSSSGRYIISANKTGSILGIQIVLEDCKLDFAPNTYGSADSAVHDTWFTGITVMAKNVVYNPTGTSGIINFLQANGVAAVMYLLYDNITTQVSGIDPTAIKNDDSDKKDYLHKLNPTVPFGTRSWSYNLDLSNYFTDLTSL